MEELLVACEVQESGRRPLVSSIMYSLSGSLSESIYRKRFFYTLFQSPAHAALISGTLSVHLFERVLRDTLSVHLSFLSFVSAATVLPLGIMASWVTGAGDPSNLP
jgi:hypothetical protein